MWYIFLVLVGEIARQTDWMGGQGVFGPVSDWGTQYWVSDSVTVATPGQVSLIATSWNYSNWVKHIVESNTGIQTHAQGLMPADIDGDGIKDLVAHTADEVVWYKHDGSYNFSKNIIGPAAAGYDNPCAYPCDIDQDGDIDVLVAANGIGCGWYENQSLSWVYHNLDNSFGYHRISATDVENDGDPDVIAVDNTAGGYCGNIYLFRNDGSQNFTKELVAASYLRNTWRVYPVDLNNDGFPDLYSAADYLTSFFLNNGSGTFTQSFVADIWSGSDFDGAWASDIDMDGDMDLVCGVHSSNPNTNGFYAFLNNGTGTNFTITPLSGTEAGGRSYGDGSITCDVDLDGTPDIAGAVFKVGWFRQTGPLTFTLWNIDSVNVGSCHWVYAAPTCAECLPSSNILITYTGAHVVYENNMLLGFAGIGNLESSILELTSPDFEACSLLWFGYKACVPSDSSLDFYWRTGIDSSDLVTNAWNGPYYATAGVNINDSFALSGDGRMFQYRVELKPTPNDMPVLYEVWLNYYCSGVGIEDNDITQQYNSYLQFSNEKLVLYLPQKDNIQLKIYDITGRLTKNVFDGYLPSGTYEFGIYLKPGIYFAKLYSNSGSENLKFITLKP